MVDGINYGPSPTTGWSPPKPIYFSMVSDLSGQLGVNPAVIHPWHGAYPYFGTDVVFIVDLSNFTLVNTRE